MTTSRLTPLFIAQEPNLILSFVAGLEGGVHTTIRPKKIQGMCFMTVDFHPGELLEDYSHTTDARVVEHGSQGTLFSVKHTDVSCFLNDRDADSKFAWHVAVDGVMYVEAYSAAQQGVANIATRVLAHRKSRMLLAVATLEHPPPGFSPFLVVLRESPADANNFYTPACAALAGVEPERALRVQQLAGLAVSPDQQEAMSAAVLLLPELRAFGISVPSLIGSTPSCSSALPNDASATCDTLLIGMRDHQELLEYDTY
jgi:hypothetical protein